MSVYDVPANELIEAVAEDLEKKFKVKQPEWVIFVKTSSSKERAPIQKNWYYLRMASILYRIYKDGPVGVSRLRTYYGSKKNRGVKKEHFRKAGGKIIRTCLQELEKLGFVEKKGKAGRVVTAKGQSYMDKKAYELKKKLEKEGKLKSAVALVSGGTSNAK